MTSHSSSLFSRLSSPRPLPPPGQPAAAFACLVVVTFEMYKWLRNVRQFAPAVDERLACEGPIIQRLCDPKDPRVTLRYGLPGGKLVQHERPLDGLKRELSEEYSNVDDPVFGPTLHLGAQKGFDTSITVTYVLDRPVLSSTEGARGFHSEVLKDGLFSRGLPRYHTPYVWLGLQFLWRRVSAKCVSSGVLKGAVDFTL